MESNWFKIIYSYKKGNFIISRVITHLDAEIHTKNINMFWLNSAVGAY